MFGFPLKIIIKSCTLKFLSNKDKETKKLKIKLDNLFKLFPTLLKRKIKDNIFFKFY